MRAVAWAFQYPGDQNSRSACLITGTSVIVTSDDKDDQGWVYQWTFDTLDEAKDKAIRRAKRAETNKGQLMKGPVDLTLPAEVTKEIRLNANGGRYPAPALHHALFKLIK